MHFSLRNSGCAFTDQKYGAGVDITEEYNCEEKKSSNDLCNCI